MIRGAGIPTLSANKPTKGRQVRATASIPTTDIQIYVSGLSVNGNGDVSCLVGEVGMKLEDVGVRSMGGVVGSGGLVLVVDVD